MIGKNSVISVGAKIIVHNPDRQSREDHKVARGDVAKVVGLFCSDRVLAFNPDWENKDRTGNMSFSYQGPCVVLFLSEFEVIKCT